MLGVFLGSPAHSTAPVPLHYEATGSIKHALILLIPQSFGFLFCCSFIQKNSLFFLREKVAAGSHKRSTRYVSNAALSKWTRNNVERGKKIKQVEHTGQQTSHLFTFAAAPHSGFAFCIVIFEQHSVKHGAA